MQNRKDLKNRKNDDLTVCRAMPVCRSVLGGQPCTPTGGSSQAYKLGPGAFLPPNLEIHVSAGLNYMFADNIKPALLTDTYNEFCRVLRWRLYFSKNDKGSHDKYYPDYQHKVATSQWSPKAESSVERALEKGQQFVRKYTYNVPNLITEYHSATVNVHTLSEYMKQHQLIVLQTDKNLGACVVMANWIRTQTIKLLSDKQKYSQIDDFEVDERLTRTRSHIEDFATRIIDFTQFQGFLQSKIWTRNEEALQKLPTFYCIPKIHKTPWAVRPILPCHSLMQAPTAKFMSKMLKPIIAEQRTLIQGTKDLAIKFSSIKWPYSKKWICTGNIVAWYPNVPLKEAIPIVDSYVAEYYERNPSPESFVVREALHWINNDLMFEFQGQFYHQKDGLAMGLACSPDIANLYTCHFEDINPAFHRLPFYGRYMDDCIAICHGSSEAEVLSKLEQLTFGSALKVVWNISEYHQPFLDMFVFYDDSSRRKLNINHIERHSTTMNKFHMTPTIHMMLKEGLSLVS